jgi:hypothetical protein
MSCGLWALLSVTAPPPVSAQSAPAKKPSSTAVTPAKKPSSTAARKPTVTDLQKKLDQQRAELEKTQAQLDSTQARLETQQKSLEAQTANQDSLLKSIAQLRDKTEDLQRQLDFYAAQVPDSTYRATLEKRLKEVEAEATKLPELPPDTITAEFPGSIRIPGSDAAIKFGGRIRASFVLTFDPLGTDDRFLTNSIPVADTADVGEARRTNFSARTSRLNFEFRTKAGEQQVRTFIEGDFAATVGNANAFRLRHAYAQFMGVIVGQTWSTFSDPEIYPQDLDFEGISSENVIRQPQARYWWRNQKGARIAFAAETPSVSASGGVGVNLVPDLVARAIRADQKGGHIQLSAVLRQIRVQPASFPGRVDSDIGWGASASGVVVIPRDGLKDRIAFQANGGYGIARYINDLQSLGGSDAVVNPADGTSQPLPVFGWYVDYEHEWSHWSKWRALRLRSCVLWSVVGVDNLDYQPDDAYRTTSRIAGNVIVSPTPRIDMGLEYIHGRRENKDGRHASANQIQIVTIFNF